MMPQNETTFIQNMGTGQTVFVKDSKGLVTHTILRYAGGQEKIQKKLK